jgi:hypothetical protein
LHHVTGACPSGGRSARSPTCPLLPFIDFTHNQVKEPYRDLSPIETIGLREGTDENLSESRQNPFRFN